MAPLYTYCMEIESSYWPLGSITSRCFRGGPARESGGNRAFPAGLPYDKTYMYYEKLHEQLITIFISQILSVGLPSDTTIRALYR